MGSSLQPMLICSILTSFFLLSSAQSCLNYIFKGDRNYRYCNDLPYLYSYIHYNYNATDGSLHFAYRHTNITKKGTWVSWAINLIGTSMPHAQCFIAYQREDGSMTAYASQIYDYKPVLMPQGLSFPMMDLSAAYENNEIVIFGSFVIPENKTTINQLWQDGPVKDEIVAMHDSALPNLMSRGTIDLLLGKSTFNRTVPNNPLEDKKNLHATLNVVSWGLMMPIGTMMGRYIKVIESADQIVLYIHIAWQTISYIIGMTGWAIGMQMGSTIHRGKDLTHKTLGIMLFFLATIQVLALFIRPKQDDKYRCYWTLYHKIAGYAIIIISIVNIFRGFIALTPGQEWMREYFVTIFVLFVIGIFLRVYTYKLIEKRNQMIGVIKQPPHIQLRNSVENGYEGRERYGV